MTRDRDSFVFYSAMAITVMTLLTGYDSGPVVDRLFREAAVAAAGQPRHAVEPQREASGPAVRPQPERVSVRAPGDAVRQGARTALAGSDVRPQFLAASQTIY